MEPCCWLLEEQQALADGYTTIAGIDEAGRGALAGPVVAACVVLPLNLVPLGINDSKKLSLSERERCYHIVLSSALSVGIGTVDAKTIDSINILRATHQAMRLALQSLSPQITPDIALIDGLPVHPFPVAQRALVGGDAKSASIAAASVIAKVTRDRLMCNLAITYPQYGFDVHKGYGTSFHLNALTRFGPCPEHRRSYRPVAACAGGELDHLGQALLDLEVEHSG